MFRLISESSCKVNLENSVERKERHAVLGYVWVPNKVLDAENVDIVDDIYLINHGSVVGTVLLRDETSFLVYVRPGSSINLQSETQAEENNNLQRNLFSNN